MKQAEDDMTGELPVTKPGPKPILGRAMTGAERKERSRLLAAVRIGQHFDQAEKAVGLLRHEIDRPSPAIEGALASLEEHLADLRFLIDK